MTPDMIVAKNLTKTYADFVAVDGIDFTVKQGESFGLLGPNGAGKSTTMKMISSVSKRTSGELTILGKDPDKFGPEIRAHLGVVPQKDMLDRELKSWENLYTYGRYFGLSRKFLKPKVEELLAFAQLEDKRNEKVEDLSGGMQRRLAIARGLVNEPEMLLLDEPTTGLDPQARHILWDRLFRLKEQGVTLVITTHYMDEAEQLCDRLIVMDKGKIMAEGSPADLIKQYSSKEVVEVSFCSSIFPVSVFSISTFSGSISIFFNCVLSTFISEFISKSSPLSFSSIFTSSKVGLIAIVLAITFSSFITVLFDNNESNKEGLSFTVCSEVELIVLVFVVVSPKSKLFIIFAILITHLIFLKF